VCSSDLWRLPAANWGVFAAAKNLTDEDYIVDRTRGIQTASPRQVQLGVDYQF
jgi:Fe(3+) dicitrate transport protein